MFRYITRRGFLARTSLPTTGIMLGAHKLLALDNLGGGQSAGALLPETASIAEYEALATAAVDAAHGAGATYVDVRVAERHTMEVRQVLGESLIPNVRLNVTFNYGIRVLVEGMWAFAYGTSTDPDDIIASARHAVNMGHTSANLRKNRGQSWEFVPAPVVKGAWISPIKIDPFSVAIEDQIGLMWACQNATERVPGSAVSPGSYSFVWIKENRSFASSEGSLVTQTLYRAKPYMSAMADRGTGIVTLPIQSLTRMTGGYEAVLGPNLQDEMKATTEEAVRLSRLPRRRLDVGRYPVVLHGSAMGGLLTKTVSQALELDRVMGSESGSSGTSFLSPMTDMLGSQVFSQLLNVVVPRSLSEVNSVKWDDEGVEPMEYPLIVSGRVMNYHTSRQIPAALSEWHKAQGFPVQSKGCAIAPEADNPVSVRAPHLKVAPNGAAVSVDDLCKEVGHGVLIGASDPLPVFTDQQFSSGTLAARLMLEIDKGRIVGRIHSAALQFGTKSLWKSLAGLGGANTVCQSVNWAFKGQPWIATEQSATSPAGMFKGVDVISTGVKL